MSVSMSGDRGSLPKTQPMVLRTGLGLSVSSDTCESGRAGSEDGDSGHESDVSEACSVHTLKMDHLTSSDESSSESSSSSSSSDSSSNSANGDYEWSKRMDNTPMKRDNQSKDGSVQLTQPSKRRRRRKTSIGLLKEIHDSQSSKTRRDTLVMRKRRSDSHGYGTPKSDITQPMRTPPNRSQRWSSSTESSSSSSSCRRSSNSNSMQNNADCSSRRNTLNEPRLSQIAEEECDDSTIDRTVKMDCKKSISKVSLNSNSDDTKSVEFSTPKSGRHESELKKESDIPSEESSDNGRDCRSDVTLFQESVECEKESHSKEPSNDDKSSPFSKTKLIIGINTQEMAKILDEPFTLPSEPSQCAILSEKQNDLADSKCAVSDSSVPSIQQQESIKPSEGRPRFKPIQLNRRPISRQINTKSLPFNAPRRISKVESSESSKKKFKPISVISVVKKQDHNEDEDEVDAAKSCPRLSRPPETSGFCSASPSKSSIQTCNPVMNTSSSIKLRRIQPWHQMKQTLTGKAGMKKRMRIPILRKITPKICVSSNDKLKQFDAFMEELDGKRDVSSANHASEEKKTVMECDSSIRPAETSGFSSASSAVSHLQSAKQNKVNPIRLQPWHKMKPVIRGLGMKKPISSSKSKLQTLSALVDQLEAEDNLAELMKHSKKPMSDDVKEDENREVSLNQESRPAATSGFNSARSALPESLFSNGCSSSLNPSVGVSLRRLPQWHKMRPILKKQPPQSITAIHSSSDSTGQASMIQSDLNQMDQSSKLASVDQKAEDSVISAVQQCSSSVPSVKRCGIDVNQSGSHASDKPTIVGQIDPSCADGSSNVICDDHSNIESKTKTESDIDSKSEEMFDHKDPPSIFASNMPKDGGFVKLSNCGIKTKPLIGKPKVDLSGLRSLKPLINRAAVNKHGRSDLIRSSGPISSSLKPSINRDNNNAMVNKQSGFKKLTMMDNPVRSKDVSMTEESSSDTKKDCSTGVNITTPNPGGGKEGRRFPMTLGMRKFVIAGLIKAIDKEDRLPTPTQVLENKIVADSLPRPKTRETGIVSAKSGKRSWSDMAEDMKHSLQYAKQSGSPLKSRSRQLSPQNKRRKSSSIAPSLTTIPKSSSPLRRLSQEQRRLTPEFDAMCVDLDYYLRNTKDDELFSERRTVTMMKKTVQMEDPNMIDKKTPDCAHSSSKAGTLAASASSSLPRPSQISTQQRKKIDCRNRMAALDRSVDFWRQTEVDDETGALKPKVVARAGTAFKVPRMKAMAKPQCLSAHSKRKDAGSLSSSSNMMSTSSIFNPSNDSVASWKPSPQAMIHYSQNTNSSSHSITHKRRIVMRTLPKKDTLVESKLTVKLSKDEEKKQTKDNTDDYNNIDDDELNRNRIVVPKSSMVAGKSKSRRYNGKLMTLWEAKRELSGKSSASLSMSKPEYNVSKLISKYGLPKNIAEMSYQSCVDFEFTIGITTVDLTSNHDDRNPSPPAVSSKLSAIQPSPLKPNTLNFDDGVMMEESSSMKTISLSQSVPTQFGWEQALKHLHMKHPDLSKEISREWVRLQWKHVVFALSEVEQTFPDYFEQECYCCFDNCVRMMEQKVQNEFIHADRPILRRIYERDYSSAMNAVYIICCIFPNSSSSLVISDGSYEIRCEIDEVISEQISMKKMIKVGTRLQICGAQLSLGSNSEAVSPLESRAQELSLKLCANGMNVVPWFARLGRCTDPYFIRSLPSIHPRGGLVPCVMVQIERVFPVQFDATGIIQVMKEYHSGKKEGYRKYRFNEKAYQRKEEQIERWLRDFRFRELSKCCDEFGIRLNIEDEGHAAEDLGCPDGWIGLRFSERLERAKQIAESKCREIMNVNRIRKVYRFRIKDGSEAVLDRNNPGFQCELELAYNMSDNEQFLERFREGNRLKISQVRPSQFRGLLTLNQTRQTRFELVHCCSDIRKSINDESCFLNLNLDLCQRMRRLTENMDLRTSDSEVNKYSELVHLVGMVIGSLKVESSSPKSAIAAQRERVFVSLMNGHICSVLVDHHEYVEFAEVPKKGLCIALYNVDYQHYDSHFSLHCCRTTFRSTLLTQWNRRKDQVVSKSVELFKQMSDESIQQRMKEARSLMKRIDA